MTKIQYEDLLAVLDNRFTSLKYKLSAHTPTNNHDGAGKTPWRSPENVKVFNHSQLDRNLAVGDFQALLKEIKTLK